MNCFVIMPFSGPDSATTQAMTSIYEDWLKPAVEGTQLPGGGRIQCTRGDHDLRMGEIVRHIVGQLLHSDLVIADLTGRNANVFYELGVRHAVANRTILITQDIDDVPFDLRSLRVLDYAYEDAAMRSLQSRLQRTILHIVAAPDEIDNPVRRYLHDAQVEKIAAESSERESQLVQEMSAELRRLRSDFGASLAVMKEVAAQLDRTRPLPLLGEDYRAYEGVWVDDVSGTHLYLAFDRGKIEGPYCFGGDHTLTGHYHDFRAVGDHVFVRFDWFDSAIGGYAMLRLESPNLVVGGWWYEEDVAPDVRNDPVRLVEGAPGMYRIVLRRKQGHAVPEWVRSFLAGRRT